MLKKTETTRHPADTTSDARPVFRRSRGPGGLLDRIQPSGELVALITSLAVGIGTGLAAVLFNLLIQGVRTVGFTWLPQAVPALGSWVFVIVPALGGLVAGPIIFRFAREAKGHGVPEVMQAIALKGGRIRPQVAVVKALASSVTIGTGGSVGREGPIVQIGAALGSTVGQVLRLSDERIRNLAACGAAGGIAATFNAPIAGVIFALEVILGEVTVSHVGTIVISAVTASTVMRAVVGSEFAFPIPHPYALNSVWEFGFYIVLGLLAALVATAFVRTLYLTEDFFERQNKIVVEWLQPAAGGLVLGLLALGYPLMMDTLAYTDLPQVFGGGYEPITRALAGEELLGAAVMLLFLKMIATNLTLGSGGSGGIFAPSLFMGAMLGVALGLALDMLFPGLGIEPGAYALVGMGAVFAGAAHAPVTAVIMLFELTGDYRIVLPLMLTIVVAMMAARRLLGGESIYTLKLTRRGIRLQRGRDVDVLQSVSVDEIMTRDVHSVPESMTIVELSEHFSQMQHHGSPVIDAGGKLAGIVTITDLERAVSGNLPRRTTVAQIATPREHLLVAYPDEVMGVVLARMGTRGLGRLPVVSREEPDRLLGMVRRADVIQAYQVALTRRAELQHRARRMQLRNIDGTEFIDIDLIDSDVIVGRRLSELASRIPADCILISVKRDGRVLIPHGDTMFQAGDKLTAFVRSQDVPSLLHWVHGLSETG